MQKTGRIVSALALLVVIVSVGAVLYSRRPVSPRSDKPLIATTILPLTIAVRNIAGDAADVVSVLPEGAEPHEVILSPRELVTLSRARVVVKLGLGLDSWVDEGIAATGQHPIVISVGDMLGIGQNVNPHVWLSPHRMREMSNLLTAQLQRAIPESAEQIQENGANYGMELGKLDDEYHILAQAPVTDIVTMHNAFMYLAQDYGLKVVGYLEELPESAPTPAQIATIIDTLKKYPHVPLFAESEIHPAIIQAVAHDTGRTIYVLEPLEIGQTDAGAYVRVMQKNLEQLKTALGLIHTK